MTEAMPFLQKYNITFLRPPTIAGWRFFIALRISSISLLCPDPRTGHRLVFPQESAAVIFGGTAEVERRNET